MITFDLISPFASKVKTTHGRRGSWLHPQMCVFCAPATNLKEREKSHKTMAGSGSSNSTKGPPLCAFLAARWKAKVIHLSGNKKPEYGAWLSLNRDVSLRPVIAPVNNIPWRHKGTANKLRWIHTHSLTVDRSFVYLYRFRYTPIHHLAIKNQLLAPSTLVIISQKNVDDNDAFRLGCFNIFHLFFFFSSGKVWETKGLGVTRWPPNILWLG